MCACVYRHFRLNLFFLKGLEQKLTLNKDTFEFKKQSRDHHFGLILCGLYQPGHTALHQVYYDVKSKQGN